MLCDIENSFKWNGFSYILRRNLSNHCCIDKAGTLQEKRQSTGTSYCCNHHFSQTPHHLEFQQQSVGANEIHASCSNFVQRPPQDVG